MRLKIIRMADWLDKRVEFDFYHQLRDPHKRWQNSKLSLMHFSEMFTFR